MRASKRRFGVPLHAAGVLLSLVLVSMYFMSWIYARYSTSAQDLGMGRQASFRVEAVRSPDIAEGPVTIVAEDPDKDHAAYQIVLSNPGEVAVRYDAVVTVNDEEVAQKDAQDQPVTLTGELAPGEMNKAVPLLLSVPDYSGEYAEDGSVLLPFAVTVTFTQID